MARMELPLTRVQDIAWIRLKAPDLDLQETFLTNFGMVRSARTDNKLFMRGTDPAHHIHITELGEPGVIGIAFYVSSLADLELLAKSAKGASGLERITEPGGGHRVCVKDPNGLTIEFVHGVAELEPLPIAPNVLNTGPEKLARTGELLRVDHGPSRVKRIGHAVISTPLLQQTIDWSHKHLGVVKSDDVHADDNPEELIGSFNRIDDGREFVDHHVILFMRHTSPGLNHVAFEVHDFDDLAVGHEYLKARNEDLHVWGLGRHTLGSQIFDYWKDPWGRIHEHWTDSDMLNIDHVFQSHPRSVGFKSQWGSQSPQEFRESSSPLADL